MISSVTLYPKSMDANQIEQHITTQLIPSLKKAPGFIVAKASDGHLMSPAGPPDYSKVVEFSFETLEDFYAWTQSGTEDQEGLKDQMIKAGVVMLFYEEKTL